MLVDITSGHTVPQATHQREYRGQPAEDVTRSEVLESWKLCDECRQRDQHTRQEHEDA